MAVKDWNNKTLLLTIFITAFLIRIGYILFVFGINYVDNPDSWSYNNYAVSLISGEGYKDGDTKAARPPGYPLLLAAVYSVFGRSYPAVKVIQAVVSSLTCVFIYLIALKSIGKSAAVFSGFFSCIFFSLFEMPAHILAEPLVTFLTALSILLFLYTDEYPPNIFIAAVVLGLATLTRTVTLIFPPFICLWFFIKYSGRKAVKYCIVMLAGFILTILPWTMRNFVVYKTFIPINIQAGLVFLGSNNSLSQGKFNDQWKEHSPKWEEYIRLPELESNKALFELGLDWLKKRTFFQLIKLYFLKTCTFFYPFLSEPSTKYDLTFGIILPFWLLGIYLSIKTVNRQNLLMVFVILVYYIQTLIFYANERLRSPITPYMIILAATGIESIYNRFKNKMHNYILFGSWIVFNILLYSYSQNIHYLMRILIKKLRGI